MRIPGVLQRIAICYLIASLIFLKTKVRTQFLIALALLVVYWLIMTRIAAPGFAAGDLSKEGSLASYVDRVLLGPHIWRQGKVYDPEGLLSTIPAVATTLFGVLTGHWLRSERTRWDKVAGMFVAGAVARRAWLGVEFILPDQQSALDQLLRAVYHRSRIATARALLLADRHQGISPLGVAV